MTNWLNYFLFEGMKIALYKVERFLYYTLRNIKNNKSRTHRARSSSSDGKGKESNRFIVQNGCI